MPTFIAAVDAAFFAAYKEAYIATI